MQWTGPPGWGLGDKPTAYHHKKTDFWETKIVAWEQLD